MRGCALLLSLTGAAAAPDFTGAAACRECHRSHHERQSGSRHATALRPILESPLADLLLKQRSLGDRSYRYEYARQGDAVRVTVSGAGDESRMLLEWAFGSGAQGYTPLGRFGSNWIEHRISHYTAGSRFSLTPGHAGRVHLSAEDALGIVQSSRDINRCFGCHATGVRAVPDGVDLSAMRPGVGCERCHGPGSDHIQAARAKDTARLSRTVLNSGRLPARASVEVCGECHRAPKPGEVSAMPELEDPLTVRFQPVGLMASRCFQKSGRLSCLTCHDPHENARQDSGHYTARCLGCHAASVAKSSACRRAQKENCVPCHMPRSTPAPYLSFVDHRIRVVER